MITTVTPNPSLDRTLRIQRWERGTVLRAQAARIEPSGKGVNVAVALHAAQVRTAAVLPAGGPNGQALLAMLTERGIPHHAVPVAGDVRTNITVIEDDGATTKLNEPGQPLAPQEVQALVRAALQASSVGQWIAWGGSLPAGFDEPMLADAITRCRAAGRRVALDTSDQALQHVLCGPAERMPHLVKPNTHELAALIGSALPTLGDVLDAAASLVARGVETVLVSLGGDGAVLVDRTGAYFGAAPVRHVTNTAGAGDAFLAGYLGAVEGPAPNRLASALRFGAAAVQCAGTLLDAAPADIPVQLGTPDRYKTLQA